MITRRIFLCGSTFILTGLFTCCPNPSNSSPLSIKVEVNIEKIIIVIGEWVERVITYYSKNNTERVRREVEDLTAKLIKLSIAKSSIANSIEDDDKSIKSKKQAEYLIGDTYTLLSNTINRLYQIDSSWYYDNRDKAYDIGVLLENKRAVIRSAIIIVPMDVSASTDSAAARKELAKTFRNEAANLRRLADKLATVTPK